MLTPAATASNVEVSYIVRYALTALATAVLTVVSLVVSSSTDGHHQNTSVYFVVTGHAQMGQP